eukprot:gene6186-6901_t
MEFVLGKHENELTVATYNIWNVMFHWEVRKLYIADLIKTHNIDVIAFQEVRSDRDKKRNQLHDLQELLPSHKWMLYHPINVVRDSPGKARPGWELEGIGLLSRHRILSYHQVNFTKGHGMDANARALLSAQIEVDDKEISFIVLHLSYDKRDQCDNAWDILKYLHMAGVEQTVLLGDFNVYRDHHWPIYALMNGKFPANAPWRCKRTQKPWFHGHSDYNFVDAWKSIQPHQPGYTFSNMPSPGLHSRPDRILVSTTGLKVSKAYLLGTGADYAREYHSDLYWARINTIYDIAEKLTEGIVYEDSCHWDCGPHGMCRCGICVPRGHSAGICDEMFCEACSPAKLKLYELLLLCFIAATTLIIISISVMILKCTRTSFNSRVFNRVKRSFLGKLYFIGLLLLFIIGLYLVLIIGLRDTLKLAESQIAEEKFPSDHLMLVSEIKIS